MAAQFDLENVIAEAMSSGNSTTLAQSQLQSLTNLQRQIGNANPAALSAMRGEIAATVAASQSIAQQSRTPSSAEQADAALAATSARTRATVQRIGEDLFERKIFDPYLQFDSEEEVRAYRQREAERQEYIRRELAKGTPEGDLNATNATLAQIDDAGAHGADRSPEYARTRATVVDTRDEQLAAMRRAGVGSPETETAAAKPPAPNNADLGEIAAVLNAAGVQSPSADRHQPGDHGLASVAVERGGNAAGRFT